MHYWVAANYLGGRLACLLVTTDPVELMKFQETADTIEEERYVGEEALPALKVLLQEALEEGARIVGNAVHLL